MNTPAPAPRKAALAFIFVTVLIDMLAFGMIIPVLPMLVQDFMGGDAARAAQMYGVFGTAWALMQFIFSPVQGSLSDHFGRRTVILVSCAGLGLDFILMALAPNLWWLLAGRVISGMICFVAFFGVALGLGNWLPSMMAKAHDFTVSKSLLYTAGVNLAFPLASGFMMYALERYGRKVTAVSAFVLAGLAAVAVGLAGSTEMFIATLFVMTFFIQLAGNSSQIFIAEVFPTNARASGFGLAQSAGRLASAGIIPGILIVMNAYGVPAVFIAIAISLVVAAIAVTQVGPEARGLALDAVAPPTA